MLITNYWKKGDKDTVSESFPSSIESSLVSEPSKDFDQADPEIGLDDDDKEIDDR